MAEIGKEKKQVYIVIALLVVAALVAYFRFGPKLGGRGGPKATTDVAGAGFEIPALPPWLSDLEAPLATDRAPYAAPTRNIFAPESDMPAASDATDESASTTPPANEDEGEKDKQRLRLSAVMKGAGGDLAVINGEFLRLGETIDGYTVIEITRKFAKLRKGDETLVLRVGR